MGRRSFRVFSEEFEFVKAQNESGLFFWKGKTVEKIIEVDQLNKSFPVYHSQPGWKGIVKGLFFPEKSEIEAVKGVSFDVQPGERIAFIGPNGAGKSTTIKMLSGILHPTSGFLKVAGFQPQKERRKLAYQMGTVFGQKSQLWPHLPAIHTFNLLAKIYDMSPKDFQDRLAELVEVFQIEPFLKQVVRKMSLGQRMRCEIVASLLHRPKILFLDEPTIGLDVAAKASIRDLIREASEVEGTTVFLTSHDTGDMERVCERVIVINHGELLLDSSLASVRESYIQKKVIELYTVEEGVHLKMAGVRVLESRDHYTKVEVSTSERAVDEVIVEALKQTRLRDITVEDPPMEDIVQLMYQS